MEDNVVKLLKDDSFHEQIKTGITLVDFYADWCGPCRMLTPILEKVAQDLEEKVSFAKLDIDAEQKIASEFQVTSVPTLVLFKGGKEVNRLVGLRDEQGIKDFIQTAL